MVDTVLDRALKNSLKIKRGGILEIILMVLSVVAFEFVDQSSSVVGKIVFLISLFSNIQLMWRFRRVDIFIIFLFFSVIHIIYVVAYYYLNIPYSYIIEYQTLYNTNNVMFFQFIFLRILFIGINPLKFNIPRSIFVPKNNDFIFFSVITILLVLIPLSTNGLVPTALTGDYSIETQSSIWFEYCIIFLIIGSVYANSKFKKYLLIGIGIIFMLMPLLYGKRLATIMVGLVIFNLYFSGRFNMKKLLTILIAAFILLRVFANFRAGNETSILQSILSIDDNGIMSNGPGGVLVCSVTYFELINQEIFDWNFSFKSFIGMFTSILIPASLNFQEAYINFEALKYATIPGNGGFPGVYLYLWGRYFGIFIGGLLLNFLIRKSQVSRVAALYVIFLLSTFPRWYTYNMSILIKMGFWLLLFIAISDTFAKYTNNTNS